MSTGAGDAGTPQHSGGIGPSLPLRVAAAALTACLWAANLVVGTGARHAVLGTILIAALTTVSVTDLETRRITNRVTGAAGVLGLLAGLVMHPGGVPGQVAAGLGAGAFLFVFALASHGGLGMGDVKLGIVLGVFLGKYVIVALIIGLLASGVLGLLVLARYGWRAGRQVAIPMGPFLALGGVVALLAGASLLPSG